MAKIRPGKLPHLEFLAKLRQLVARHGYTMAPLFDRIAVYDAEGRTVCSFRRMEGGGPVDLRFGEANEPETRRKAAHRGGRRA